MKVAVSGLALGVLLPALAGLARSEMVSAPQPAPAPFAPAAPATPAPAMTPLDPPVMGPPAPAPLPLSRTPAKAGAKRAKAPRWPTVVLFQVNRRETLRFRIADDQGRPIRGLQKRMNRFLRCHQTNQQHAMNPRLLRLIYETGRHYPGKRIEVISGYRHPTVAKNPHSPHMKGLACDMHVDGVKNTELRDYFRRTFKHVGVGYYPNSSFVHLDVREGSSAFWIDYSGPGQKAIYSDNPEDDLRSGRADRWKPAKIDTKWVDEGDSAPAAPPGAVQTVQPGGDDASGGLAAGARESASVTAP